MREWRNRQTHTFKGRVGDRMGSSPISRTNKSDFVFGHKKKSKQKFALFSFSLILVTSDCALAKFLK